MKTAFLFFIFIAALNCCAQDYSKCWKDLNYAGDTMIYHNLDIYLPDQPKESYPVVISIYGSAWFANNAKGADLKILGSALLNAGFAVVTPNHRSSRDAKFPAQIHDIKAAIRFVRANADKYKLDTAFIGITGSSSGGNMAAMAGTSGYVREFSMGSVKADIEGNVGSNTSYSSSVHAVADWFGPTNMLIMDSCGGTDFTHNAPNSPASLYIGGPIQENKEKTLLASPTTYVDSNDPPFLILHGDNDRVVPFCQSQTLYDTLKNANVPCRFILVQGGQHGPVTQSDPYVKIMVDFFNKVKSGTIPIFEDQ